MKFRFLRGQQNTIRYLAGADIPAGDYVPLAGATKPGLAGGIAIRDIKSGEIGSLDIGGQSQYRCKVGGAYAAGAAVFSDGSDTLTTAGDLFGYMVHATSGAGEAEVNLAPRTDPDVTPGP